MTKEQRDVLREEIDKMVPPRFVPVEGSDTKFKLNVDTQVLFSSSKIIKELLDQVDKLEDALSNIRDLKYPYDDNSPRGYARRILEEIATQ